MNFEIRDGRERLPDEEDVYGVNDIEEQEQFNALFGDFAPQEERIRRRKIRVRIFAGLVILALILGFVLFGLRSVLGW